MQDADACPFDPTRWSVDWIRRPRTPRTWITMARLTSCHGSDILARPGTTPDYLGGTLPVWWLRETATKDSIGCVSRTEPDDPTGDIRHALHRGDALSGQLRRLERWMLEHGVRGGTWLPEGRMPTFWDGSRVLKAPDHIIPGFDLMLTASRLVRAQDRWQIRSGRQAAALHVPSTGHAVLARLAELRQEAA